MDWPKIISEILWMEEITEKELSHSLTTPVTQGAINRIKKGYVRSPSYNLGDELIRRHKKLSRNYPTQQMSK